MDAVQVQIFWLHTGLTIKLSGWLIPNPLLSTVATEVASSQSMWVSLSALLWEILIPYLLASIREKLVLPMWSASFSYSCALASLSGCGRASCKSWWSSATLCSLTLSFTPSLQLRGICQWLMPVTTRTTPTAELPSEWTEIPGD